MKLTDRIEILSLLGKMLQKGSEALDNAIVNSRRDNPWFTKESCHTAINALAKSMLIKESLIHFASKYNIQEIENPKKVLVVMAGNIPLVGFHDLVCVFLSGNIAIIKQSSKDQTLMPLLIEMMAELEPRIHDFIKIEDRFAKNFEVVIATGSNNTSRYFEEYFGKYPHIIRKNRTSVAVLTNHDTTEDFNALGFDIFQYYGLGCRNVSKIFVPRDFDFPLFLESLIAHDEVILIDRYKNNFDHNTALFILNGVKYMSNGYILLVEQKQLVSPIAVLYYEYYDDLTSLENNLILQKDAIQCIVSNHQFDKLTTFPLGSTQYPTLTDYADGVDTMDFLMRL
jgi:hypothetical protein